MRSSCHFSLFTFHFSFFVVTLQQKQRIACVMIYLNQFHREATERKLKKIAESQKSPMNSVDAANYMKRNFEMAKAM